MLSMYPLPQLTLRMETMEQSMFGSVIIYNAHQVGMSEPHFLPAVSAVTDLESPIHIQGNLSV